MTRLRDLGLQIGRLPVGPANAITDVGGLSVGQCAISDNDLMSGLTLIAPYNAAVGKRKLHIGSWSVGGGDAMTGLGVAEDFGTFSSPIALVPAANVGAVYDGLIQAGLGRDPGLSTYAGWPPVVVGLNDSALNSSPESYRTFRPEYLRRALEDLDGGTIREGNAGVGRGLCAFGLKGGVGTSSRVLPHRGASFQVGALVTANAGESGDLCVGRYPLAATVDITDPLPNRPRTFAAVVATDAPLIPLQARQLAFRATSGLYRVGLADARTEEGITLAFSSVPAEPIGAAGDHQQVHSVADDLLVELAVAAADCCEEAVVNSLLAAAPVARNGVQLLALESEGWPPHVERFQREAR